MRDKYKLRNTRITKIAGICGILIPIVVFIFVGLAMTHSPWFEWTEHALSDLGVNGLSAIFFNSGMVIAGILAFIFSLGLMKVLTKKIGAYILCLSSIALIGIGLFPETIFPIHFFTSASFFILLAISLLIIGLTINKQNKFERKMGILASFFAILAFSSAILIIGLEGVAIPESLSCFPAFIWIMIFGVKMTFM